VRHSYAVPYIAHVVPLYHKEIDGCGRLHLFGVVVKHIKSKDIVLVGGGREIIVDTKWMECGQGAIAGLTSHRLGSAGCTDSNCPS
jgi:hypothetical protein